MLPTSESLPHLPRIRAVPAEERRARRKLAKSAGKKRRVPWRHLDLGSDYRNPVANPRLAFPKLDVETLAPDTAAEVENIWMLGVMDHEAQTQDRIAAKRDALLVRGAAALAPRSCARSHRTWTCPAPSPATRTPACHMRAERVSNG